MLEALANGVSGYVLKDSNSSDLVHAARLGISTRTAETHRSRVMHKLGLHTQSDLIRYAIRRGIIPMVDVQKK